MKLQTARCVLESLVLICTMKQQPDSNVHALHVQQEGLGVRSSFRGTDVHELADIFFS